jgi:mannose-6-phosphate isomerase-like protein (cupin superfamily)
MTPNYTRYTFRGRTGYVIDSSDPGVTQKLVAVGHTDSVAPWSDPGIHLHRNAEEYYFLFQGELRILVVEKLVSLRPKEILMVKPQVPHAIVGGEGLIEHIGIRAPAKRDKQLLGNIPNELPPTVNERERELRCDWGYRIPLEASKNQNCWLLGTGIARFRTSHLILAFLNFPTTEAANAGIGTRHRLHRHQTSWEYYAALKGAKTLQIEDELVKIEAGEILGIPPMICHTLHSRQAPYEGFTFRVPIPDQHDKVECSPP